MALRRPFPVAVVGHIDILLWPTMISNADGEDEAREGQIFTG